METTIFTLDQEAKRFSGAMHELGEASRELAAAIQDAKNRAFPKIKRLASAVAERRAALHAAIESAPFLFEKPRTLVLHGVKVGFAKSRGEIVWDDADQVVRLIERHFPDQADLLIHLRKSPNKEALVKLPASDLKRLGCEITSAGDSVVIKTIDSDTDKIISAFLRELEKEDSE